MQINPATAKVHSVNVSGALRSVLFAGHVVTTGFFKSAVSGVAHAHKPGIEGDAQGDLSVHGGLDKAVYFYSREHYAAWEELLGSGPLPAGSFGENVTSDGLLERISTSETYSESARPHSRCSNPEAPAVSSRFALDGPTGPPSSSSKESRAGTLRCFRKAHSQQETRLF